jgi:hypothetical protein
MRIFLMTIHVKPESLAARCETRTVPAAHASSDQKLERTSHPYVQLLPFMIFCFGMPIAAIPMMLG